MKRAKPSKFPAAANERRSQIIGWSVAVGLHLLLLLIAAFLNIGWRYDIPEWVQMEFISTNRLPSRAAPPKPAEPPSPKKTLEKKRNIVTLPKRRMLEDEPPLLRPERTRDEFIEETPSRAVKSTFQSRPQDVDARVLQAERTGKATVDVSELQTGDKPVQVEAPDLGKGISVPFQIEGEAAERTVVNKVIPEHPGGLARESVVKISFVVLPSGVVANAVPTLKSDARLEKAALDAFRQWRFSPLPSSAEQRPQRGIVTFRFVLK